MTKKTRVLVVDDQAVMRNMFTKILMSDPAIEVVGTATDPYDAREKLVQLKPDVMTLDIEMPKMDGLTFLTKVMEHFPTRTIVVSSLTQRNSELSLRALEMGAVDVIGKPSSDLLASFATELCERVKQVARSTMFKRNVNAHAGNLQKVSGLEHKAFGSVIGIASSTGGTEALRVVLSKLPADLPPILVVQHMPPVFTNTFAQRLNDFCALKIKEASDGEKVLWGNVYIAPGDFHMEMQRSPTGAIIQLHQKPLHKGVRPSADILMKSIAKYYPKSLGVVLTGMGTDGTDGLIDMRKAGSYNIAQDESSCVVYGMPKAAVEAKCVDQVVNLEKISDAILEQLKKRSKSVA